MKKGLIFMALCLCLAAVTVSADIVWSSAFDFDGTPTTETVEIDVNTPIGYSSYLRNNPTQNNAVSLTITATSQEHPVYVADIFYAEKFQEITGTEVWNFNDSKYATFPKNDTYTLQEVIECEDWDDPPNKSQTILTRTITLAPEPAIVIVLGLVSMLFLRRRLKGLCVALLMISLGTFSALADSPVSSVTCQQGWPLSRKVIITYTAAFTGRMNIKFYGTTDNGATTFELKDKGTLDLQGKNGYIYGSWDGSSSTYTTIWTPDSTLDSVKGKIKIGIELIDPNADPDDISDDSSATKDQYRYISSIPSGGWSDMYKKMEETLKLVPAETFTKKGSSEEKDETQHQVTLIKSSYDGVFEVAQEQCL